MLPRSSYPSLTTRVFIGLVTFLALGVVNLAGCGGRASVTVAVTASATSVDGADSTTLTATVTNDSNSAGVTWALSGAGKLSNTTTSSATFTAPAPTNAAQTATITVTSVADTSKTATVTITVPPLPSITTGALAAGTVGTTYTATLTATGGIAPYTWSLASGTLPTCLTITQSSSGASITGTLMASCAGTYNITLKVTDSGTPTPLTATTVSLSLTINAAPAITFTGVMPATGTYNASYTGSAAATGGAGALTYSATGLPAWLTLNTSSGAVTGTPTAVGTFNFTIKAADAYGDSQSQAYSIVVNPEVPTLTFAAISTKTYGNAPFTVSASSASSGAITYSVTSGPATINSSTGLVTLTGAGTVVLGASQAASGDYAAATASTSFTVNPEVPTLVFAAIPTETYGNAPFTVSASSASSGTVTYSVTSGPATINSSSGLVTLTGAGTVVLGASQAASGNYAAATASVSFTVYAEAPTLTFAAIPTQTYGAAPFTVSASSASSGAVTYSVTSGPATVNSSSGLVTLTGAGTVVLGASQAASGNYGPATASVSFTVNPGTPTLTFAAIPTETYGNAPFTVSASSASSGAITYSVTSGPATINSSSGLVTLTGVGTVVLGASQAATTNYTTATASTSFTVNPEVPTLVFAAIPTETYGNAPFTVSASSASSGAITYSVTSGPATINSSSGLVTLTGAGTVVLGASQAASGNYAAATASTSFTVNAEVPTLVFAAITTQTYGNAPFTVSASSASSGTVTYSVTSGPATINSSTGLVTLTGAGTVVLGASQAASGNYAAATATTSFTVNPEAPTLVFAAIPTENYGSAPFTVSASSASSGAVTYSVTSGPATINSSTGLVTLTGVGTVVLGASQAATTNYTAATASTSFTVNQGTPTLVFAAIPTETYGNAPFTVSASSASSGTVTYSVTSGPATINSSTGLVTLTGVGTVVLGASQAATTDYTAATGSTSFTVNPETPALVFTPIPTYVYGDPPFTASASSASSGAITYSVTSGPATINSSTGLVTLTGAGTVVLGASQAASGNYAATTASISFTVNPAVSITTTSPLPAGVVNTNYSQTLAATGGTGGYVWTTNSAGTTSLATVNLTLSPGGLVSGKPAGTGSATFAATVTDSTSHTATVTFTVTVTNALTITTTSASLPPAYTNALYSQTLTAAGGTGLNYVWSVSGTSNLATFNMTLSSGGVLSGTPATTGTISFTAKVTDSGSNTATQALSIPVYAPLSLPAANPATLGPATTNVAYTGTIVAAGGSGSGYVFTVTGLPSDGLSNAANNGSNTLTIGGTATLHQTVSFTVSVKDGLGNTAGPVTYTIAVNPPTPLTLQTSGALAGATTNVAYNGGISANGGSGSGYVFTVNSVPIPTNGTAVLIADSISVSNLGGSTLSISGTPTQTQTVTIASVTVKDSAGDSAGPDTYTIAVNPPTPLTLQSSGALGGATTNVAYSTSISANGGSGSGYVFTVNSVPIPTNGTAVLIADSISVSNLGGSTLSISGTPTQTQTVTIASVTVKDSAGDSAGPDTYTIAVNPPTPLTLQTSGALLPATTNQAYTGSVSANGGSGSGYVFTVNSVPIPTNGTAVLIADSISVSNNGGSTLSISGTPTTAQTVTLASVTVKDSAGDNAGPDTYTIAVNPPTPLTLQAAGSLPPATTNVAYSGSINASGGSGSGYVFTVNSVPIPTNGTAVLIADSISVSSTGTNTLSISGTPTQTQEVTFANVTVKDGANDTAGPDSYTIAVNPPTPLTLQSSGSLPAATTNVGYSQSISASGGSGSGYVFTVNTVQIPNTGGLVLISDSISVYSTGTGTLFISGTPTTVGTVTLTNVTVKDSAADTAGPATYTIAVNAPGSPVSGQIQLMNYCNNGSSFALPTFIVSINTSPVQTTTTDSGGNYSFAAIPNGTYTITPSITGATSLFYPATLTNVVVNNSVSGANFNATVGYTVSGTVSYGGAATGPIYVELNSNCGGGGAANGVTLSAPGAFTIHGVSPGSYTLNSWRDKLGFAAPNASDPTRTVSNLTVSNAAVTGVAVALADPGTITLSAAPTLGTIDGFTNGVFINYKPILNNNQVELAASYTVQWSTTTSFTSPAGSHSFPAGGDHTDLWFLNSANVTGLTSGSSYYFRAQGVAGSSTSAWSSTVGPIKLAAPTAANTVTGTVTFTGTATGPLYVGFYDQSTSNAWITQVGTKAVPPTSPASYSVEVPSGTYGFFAIIDQNNNGLIDQGDLTNVNSGGNGPPSVTISGNTTESVTLPSAASTVKVTTQYSPNTPGSGIAANYNLNFDVRQGVKLPIAVTLSSGPNVINPVDMGGCGSNCGTPQFQYYANTIGYTPKVGDSYSFTVTYSDATTGTVTGTVTAVLGASALPTLISPTGTGVIDTPNFDWTYPSSAGSYTYQFYLCCGNNGTIWSIPGNNSKSNGFTSSQITPPLVWGVDPTDGTNLPSPSTLSAGTYYGWSLQATDANGNSANAQMSFETATGPVSLPAASTNPLPSGTVGVPYSGALNASGGVGGGNYYFVVNGTTIPTNNTPVQATNSDGLTFANSSGNTLFVGGTPTATATAPPLSLTIEVFDTAGSTNATVTYTIVINPEAPVSLPAASSNPLGSAVVSMPYGGSLSASGGSGSYSFTVNGTTIPSDGTTYVSIASGDGLSATSYSGGSLLVAGTPTSVASVSLDVVATNTLNSSDTATVTYTLPVVSAPSGVNNSHLSGTYVCKTNRSEDSNGSAFASVSSFVIDGNGHMTSGVFDVNGVGFSSAQSGTVTGTYSIGADNNGLATTNYTVTAGGTGSGTNTWVIALTNATSPAQEFRMVEADDLGGSPSGQNGRADCYLATTSAFAVSTISAKSFALGFQGANSSNILKEYVGRFTASTATGSGSSATGTITSGILDGMRLDQTGNSGGAFTGSYTGPNSNGRFTITVVPPGGGSGTLAAYIIDANRMFLLEIAGDTGVMSGEMRTQQQASYSNANLSGAAVLYTQALEYSSGSVSGFDSSIYRVSGNGSGTLTVNQSYDDNNGTYADGSENGAAVTVTFDSSNPGRATFSPPGSDSSFLYFYNTNSAFYLDLNGGGSPNYLATGWLEPQTQTTFTDAALAGTYMLAEAHLKPGDTSVGEVDVASNGTITASISTGGQNSFSFDSAQSGLSYTWLNTTYGSYSFTETGQSGGETCMVISASKDICMDGTSGSAKMSVLQK